MFRSIVIVAVVIGVGWAFWKAFKEFDSSDSQLSELQPAWLLASGLFYFLSMTCAGSYWLLILRTLGLEVPLSKSVPAFFAGQLGKYVPGKAMVVVIRAGMIRGKNADATVATLSVFVETLTMMAVGGFVAAAILIFIAREQTGLVVLAIGLMICSGVPTLPPIFRRIVRMLKIVRLSPQVDEAIERLSWSLMAKGWIISLGTWAFAGLSLFAVLKSLPGAEIDPASAIPVCIGCAALAAVAGFLSLIPGGLGVRELVIITLLGPFGAARAAIAAILLRLVWLVTELVVSFILYFVKRLFNQTET